MVGVPVQGSAYTPPPSTDVTVVTDVTDVTVASVCLSVRRRLQVIWRKCGTTMGTARRRVTKISFSDLSGPFVNFLRFGRRIRWMTGRLSSTG